MKTRALLSCFFCVAFSGFLLGCNKKNDPPAAEQQHWTARYAPRIAGTWQWSHYYTTWGTPGSGIFARPDTTLTVTLVQDTLAVVGTDTMVLQPLAAGSNGLDSSRISFRKQVPGAMHSNISLTYGTDNDSLLLYDHQSGGGGGSAHALWRK